jgi:enoyl-CoA hydratase/carnithine racemase
MGREDPIGAADAAASDVSGERMSGEELVAVARRGAVCVLTLNRHAKLNALSTELEQQLDRAIRSDDVVRAGAIVITGSGRAFSAGADIGEMRNADPASVMAYYRETGEVYERIARLPQASVSAIHGYCLGGGFELALATDLRVADETAVFGLPEVRIGILPSSGGTHRLVRAVGPARAKELILLRERIDAAEAHRIGLIAEVVPAGTALQRGLDIAERLAALPPLAVEIAKRAIDQMADSSREAGVLIERLAYGVLADTTDARAAADRFMSERGRGGHPER